MGFYEDIRVTVPEGRVGDWQVERFTVGKNDFQAFRYAMQGRSPGLGTFTGLFRKGQVWMSDTNAEVRDHLEAIYQIQNATVKHVLIHGLGIGMIVGHALKQPHVESVTVVELEADVIALIGAHYEQMAQELGKSLTIIHDNALTWKPPVGQRWDVVWHDIWRDLDEENREEMTLLNRRFGRRATWQGCWGKYWIDRDRRRSYA